MKIGDNAALLVIDVQNDFCPGGALPVPHGDAVVPVVNHLAKRFRHVVASQDWHPADHGSFASTHGVPVFSMGQLDGEPQVMWPDHCVQGTAGAKFHSGLNLRGAAVIRKGTDPQVDSYSAFFDNGHKHKTKLDSWLRKRGIDTLYVLGLATDYCVKFTVLDALKLGYTVYVVSDGCRGVNMNPGDSAKALRKMASATARVIHSRDVGGETAE